MTTTEFKNEWIGFSTPEIEEQFDIDLNTLINDEIERRIYEAEKGIDKRIKQGLYTNTDGYPENVFKLGFYFLKLNLLKK